MLHGVVSIERNRDTKNNQQQMNDKEKRNKNIADHNLENRDEFGYRHT